MLSIHDGDLPEILMIRPSRRFEWLERALGWRSCSEVWRKRAAICAQTPLKPNREWYSASRGAGTLLAEFRRRSRGRRHSISFLPTGREGPGVRLRDSKKASADGRPLNWCGRRARSEAGTRVSSLKRALKEAQSSQQGMTLLLGPQAPQAEE